MITTISVRPAAAIAMLLAAAFPAIAASPTARGGSAVSGQRDGTGSAHPSATLLSSRDGLYVLDHQANLTVFTRLVKASSLSKLIQSTDCTVFAPDDAAFRRMPAGWVDSLLAPGNREFVDQIVGYAVVPRHRYFLRPAGQGSAEAMPRVDVTTWMGKTLKPRQILDAPLAVEGIDGNSATDIQADIPSKNAAIHITDRVLTPMVPPHFSH